MAIRLEQKKEPGLENRQGQGGGVKPRLTQLQKGTLKKILIEESDFWTSGRIVNLIKERFLVTYTKRQVQRLLRQMKMYCYNRSGEPPSTKRF